MKYLIPRGPQGGEAVLIVDEPCACRFGIPVLEITGHDGNKTLGPGDLLGKLDPTKGPARLLMGAQIVAAWGSMPKRTEEEWAAAGRFLQQWPAGPQLSVEQETTHA